MKITDLSVTLFNWPIKPWKTGRSLFGGDIKLGVVTIQTDEDVEGYSFLGSQSQGADVFAGPLIDVLKPRLLGRNPLDIGTIWQDMWNMHRRVSLRAIGAVDVALWDLAGKVAGLPIHRMLGTCKEQVPAYASSAWLPNPEAYIEEAIRFKSLG